MNMTERRAEGLLILTTLLAAGGWIFSKEAVAGLPTFGFLGARFMLAALLLLPFCYTDLKKASVKDLLRAASLGTLLGGAVLLWIHAISISETLAEGAFIMSMTVLFVPLVALGLFKQSLPSAFWYSLPLAMIGLSLLSLTGGWQQSSTQIWFLLSAVMMAIQINVNSRFARTLPPLLLTCVQLFTAGVLSTALSLTFEQWPSHVEPKIWGWFGASVLLATSLRYVCQTLGLRGTTATNAAFIMILEPVLTVIFSLLWYGEKMPPQKLIGCLFILSALVMYRSGFAWIGKRRKAI